MFGAPVVVQFDEPSLPAALGGRLTRVTALKARCPARRRRRPALLDPSRGCRLDAQRYSCSQICTVGCCSAGSASVRCITRLQFWMLIAAFRVRPNVVEPGPVTARRRHLRGKGRCCGGRDVTVGSAFSLGATRRPRRVVTADGQ